MLMSCIREHLENALSAVNQPRSTRLLGRRCIINCEYVTRDLGLPLYKSANTDDNLLRMSGHRCKWTFLFDISPTYPPYYGGCFRLAMSVLPDFTSRVVTTRCIPGLGSMSQSDQRIHVTRDVTLLAYLRWRDMGYLGRKKRQLFRSANFS